jgi:hypothetical protein
MPVEMGSGMLKRKKLQGSMARRWASIASVGGVLLFFGVVRPELAGRAGGGDTGCGGSDEVAPAEELVRDPTEPREVHRGLFRTNRGEVELSYEMINGRAIHQGDIILPLDKELTFGAGRDIPTYEWPNNTVPYVINSDVPNQQRILDAIQHWEANTSIRFVQRTTQTSYVIFKYDADFCASSVGRQGNFSQDVIVASWCTAGNLAHEIGHLVGFWHEQSRADRDNHITVNFDNIWEGWRSQFDKYADGDDYGLYDIGSIMHYTPTNTTAQIDPNVPSMTRTDGSDFTTQRVGLSPIDREAVEEMYSQGFGRAVAVGDFNNDGYQDLAVGTPRRQPQYVIQISGVVRVYRGSANGLVFSQELKQSMFSSATEITFDRFGFSVAAGDFNGDGFDDLAVGAPGENPTNISDRSLDDSGLVYVFNGSSGAMVARQIVSQSGLGTAEGGDRFGAALAAADFNADGRDDLAVGAPGEAPNGGNEHSGLVFAYRGSSTGLTAWRTIDQGWDERGDNFGWSLAAGDFNGDGRKDLAVGAPHEKAGSFYSGHVFVFHSTTTGFSALIDVSESSLLAQGHEDFFGAALASGDFNHDGRDDLAVGAPGKAVSGVAAVGQIFLYRGTVNGLVAHAAIAQVGVLANERADAFGAALAFGDIDGDGFDDLAVGTPGEANFQTTVGAGYVYVYRGGSSGLSYWLGRDQAGLGTNESGDRFGAALVFGDFNRDARADLIVGAPGETPPSNVQSGWAFSFRGTTDGPAAWTAFGP